MSTQAATITYPPPPPDLRAVRERGLALVGGRRRGSGSYWNRKLMLSFDNDAALVTIEMRDDEGRALLSLLKHLYR